jgi:serine/threonine protein kinase
MALSPGMRLGPYDVEQLIGCGGMGEVYKARDKRLDRIVAIKVLPSGSSVPQDIRDRFNGEGSAIARLSHPHICRLYDVGEQDGKPYLVMEYLEGETLAVRLRRGPIPSI